jgi:hypothetical protein
VGLLRPEAPINWGIVAKMMPIPLVFSLLLLPLPDQPPKALQWIVFAVGLSIELTMAYLIAKRSEHSIALSHAFLIGAGGTLLVELLGLWNSVLPVQPNDLMRLVWSPVIKGLRMMFFVWLFEKFLIRPGGDTPGRPGLMEFR